MQPEPVRRHIWALIQPSAVETVAHLNSHFATAAAHRLKFPQYLALIEELPPKGKHPAKWVAFLVHPTTQLPLPDTYLPIWPCQLGPREALRPGFDWPFGQCVISTGEPLIFSPSVADMGKNPHMLPRRESERFQKLWRPDRDALDSRRWQAKKSQLRAEQEADGYGSACGSLWVEWSASSTLLPILPGQFFRPVIHISAMVSYDIEAVNYGTPEELEQDRKAIKRLLARFYRVSTERTIRWVLDVQNTERSAYILKRSAFIPQDLDEPILDLTCPPLVDFCAHIERSSSPDQIPPPATPADGQLAQADDFDYSCDVEEAEIMEPILLATPPPFDITSVSVIYFDVYDTLIDRESGIFSALRPLLKQSRYAFNRKEALSFYFESEAEMKEQKPGAPYAQILANTYRDVALRLGIAPVHATDASIFAQSAANWPCITDAGWLLHNLVHNSQISLAAIADVDREFLLRTSAFTSLAPFFEAVFTWDACHAYKPATVVFDAPLLYYDSLGVPRAHSFLVSGSLLRDMEPARQVGLPAVWIRSPGSLAANLDAVEDASPVGTFCTLSDLGNCFLGAYRAPMTWEDPPASRMRTGGPLLLPSNAPTSASISPALHHIIRRM